MSETRLAPAGLAALAAEPAGVLVDRVRDLAGNPAIRRARPAIITGAVLLAAAILWLLLRAPEWRPLYGELSDGDKAAVMTALAAGNYAARINPDTGSVEVAAGETAAARILLAGQGLPKSAGRLDPVGDMPLGLSRAVEAARLQGAAATELAASIESIDGVRHARVHVAAPEPSVFVRDKAPASASVFVTLAPGRVLGEAQVRAIVWLVSSSVAGLSPDRISIVDQSGALLSAGTTAGEAAQLGYQVKLEGLVRERLFKLLTPLIGTGRFTAEVAADVDFSRSDSSSERFTPESVLRSEAASRQLDANPPPARGIPGALSNTAPAAASLTTTPPASAGGAAPTPPAATSETTNRAWEIGKDVSITQGGAPKLRRLSVAVVIDRGALGKAGVQDIAGLTRIIRGTVGYDAQRGDLVEVQLRAFAPPPAEPVARWFDKPVVQDNMPWLVAGGAVLTGVIGGIFALVRARRARARALVVPVAAVPDDAGVGEAYAPPRRDPVDGGDLTPPPPRIVDYSQKLGATRDLVNDDADRASAVARQMLAQP